MITAYDAVMARDSETAGADLILVGDSLGRAILGYEGVNEVTLSDMIHHSKAVMRGRTHTKVISDLPEGSYSNVELAINSATQLMCTGIDAVKLEGPLYQTIHHLTQANIPVVAHLGYTPQTADKEPTQKKVRANDLNSAEILLSECLDVQKAGASMLVLEMVPREVAKGISDNLTIPVIGIGSGPDTDGQVLVCTDLWGDHHFPFKFLKAFGDLRHQRVKAIEDYRNAVIGGQYPNDSHSFHIKKSELEAWLNLLNKFA